MKKFAIALLVAVGLIGWLTSYASAYDPCPMPPCAQPSSIQPCQIGE